MSGKAQKRISDFFSGGVERKPASMMFNESINESPVAKKRRICREIEGQMALDAGQAKIGAQRCEKCDMVYSLDVEGDVVDHDNYCNGTEKRKRLVVKKSTLDTWVKRVLSLNPGHTSYPRTGSCTVVLKVEQTCTVENLKSKVEEVVKSLVNESLGYAEEGSMWNSNLSSIYSDHTPSSSQSSLLSTVSSPHTSKRPQRKAYMAILRDEKGVSSIGGVIVAEALCKAIDVDGKKMIRVNTGQLMGVNRLWVNEEMRGRGVGKILVDAARESFFSTPIPRSRVVFSEPTKDGERFARSYVRNDGERLLVYNLGDGDKWKEVMMKMIERRRRSQPITIEKKEEEEKGENTVDEENNSENVVDGELSRSPLSEQL